MDLVFVWYSLVSDWDSEEGRMAKWLALVEVSSLMQAKHFVAVFGDPARPSFAMLGCKMREVRIFI